MNLSMIFPWLSIAVRIPPPPPPEWVYGLHDNVPSEFSRGPFYSSSRPRSLLFFISLLIQSISIYLRLPGTSVPGDVSRLCRRSRSLCGFHVAPRVNPSTVRRNFAQFVVCVSNRGYTTALSGTVRVDRWGRVGRSLLFMAIPTPGLAHYTHRMMHSFQRSALSGRDFTRARRKKVKLFGSFPMGMIFSGYEH